MYEIRVRERRVWTAIDKDGKYLPFGESMDEDMGEHTLSYYPGEPGDDWGGDPVRWATSTLLNVVEVTGLSLINGDIRLSDRMPEETTAEVTRWATPTDRKHIHRVIAGLTGDFDDAQRGDVFHNLYRTFYGRQLPHP